MTNLHLALFTAFVTFLINFFLINFWVAVALAFLVFFGMCIVLFWVVDKFQKKK